jgi:lipid A ethanolaminephosphotransferase
VSVILATARRRSADVLGLLQRGWNGFRPEMAQETLALLVGAALALFFNLAFFRAVYATDALHGAGGFATGVCLLVFIAALNSLLALVLFNRWTVKPVLALLLPVSAAASYYMDHYGIYFDTDMMANVLHTDMRESSELLSLGLVARVLMMGILPAALAWRIRLKHRRAGRAVAVRMLAIVATLLVAVGAALLSFQSVAALMRNHHEIRHLVTPGNYLVSLGRVAFDRGASRNQPRTELGAGAHVVDAVPGERPRLLVIVVGETVRARNWGLNGYARQTTPQLSRMDVVDFRDVSSCGTATEVSLPCMFSPYPREAYSKDKVRNSESLLHILDHAGVAVTWIDNQGGCKGVCAGLDFQSYEHGKDPEFCDAEGCLDGVLLKALAGAIPAHAGDAVIVLHQLGNHGPAYYKRYPSMFRSFSPTCESSELGDCRRQDVVNAYDNAILYTDDLLARAIRMLAAQSGRDAALLYVSDHGESLGEGGLYLHGMPYAIAPEEQKKVPLMMWLSPGYSGAMGLNVSCLKEKAATAAFSHDNFFHTVLGMMKVSAPEYRRDMDLFEGCLTDRGGAGDP